MGRAAWTPHRGCARRPAPVGRRVAGTQPGMSADVRAIATRPESGWDAIALGDAAVSAGGFAGGGGPARRCSLSPGSRGGGQPACGGWTTRDPGGLGTGWEPRHASRPGFHAPLSLAWRPFIHAAAGRVGPMPVATVPSAGVDRGVAGDLAGGVRSEAEGWRYADARKRLATAHSPHRRDLCQYRPRRLHRGPRLCFAHFRGVQVPWFHRMFF